MTPDLTGELQRQVRLLEDDLRERITTQPAVLATWQAEHQGALDRGRTAAVWEAWRDDRVTQAAVAWVLTTVFVKFCEDNARVSHELLMVPSQALRYGQEEQSIVGK